jgi:hypothetical protein
MPVEGGLHGTDANAVHLGDLEDFLQGLVCLIGCKNRCRDPKTQE